LKKRLGFIGVDIIKSRDVDVICNLERNCLPFASESFVVVYANHVLEHINNLENLLSEVSRVMKPGAKFLVCVPYAGHIRAFQDPTHVRFFTLKTFEYFILSGSSVGQIYTKKYFNCILKRSLVFGYGFFSLFISLIVNRHICLKYFYESSILRIIPARNINIELIK
jgi:SAM-dependent methyltransferase